MKKFNKLVIRLHRVGHIYYALYYIVVTTSNKRAGGHFIEKLGFFNPQFSERLFFIDSTRLIHWVSCGAKINKTVLRCFMKLLVKQAHDVKYNKNKNDK